MSLEEYRCQICGKTRDVSICVCLDCLNHRVEVMQCVIDDLKGQRDVLVRALQEVVGDWDWTGDESVLKMMAAFSRKTAELALRETS